MAIKGLGKDEFKSKLNEYLSASGPVRSIQHLLGREKEMALIDEALCSEGRHVFIFGDRGVGKTSLAAAAANLYQDSTSKHIQIGCGPDTSFYRTIEDLADRIIKKASGKRDYETTHAVNVKIYSIKWHKSNEKITIPTICSMYTAVEALEEVAKYHSKTPIIVIDEFDQITCEEERKKFAIFLKDLGDRGVNIKLIFTGVGQSLTKLLGDHASSYRQLHTIELDRLNWSARETISKEAFKSMGLTVDNAVVDTIAKLSNGFPYFVHLLTEKLLWCVFNDDDLIQHVSMTLFQPALEKAIGSIEAHLQGPYNLAALHRTADFRDILWATADSENTIRYIDGMFASYIRIHEKIHGFKPSPEGRPISRTAFVEKLRKLKKPEYGQILENVGDRNGIYSYRENILRGFVAMKALESGVELFGDVPDEPKRPTALSQNKRQFAAHKDFTPRVKFRGESDEDENVG